MFGNFQKETLEENGSGSTVSLDSNSTSARGTKGSWGWGEGTGTNPWCLAVSSAPAVWTGPSPPSSASPVLLDKSVSFLLGLWDFLHVLFSSLIWLDGF